MNIGLGIESLKGTLRDRFSCLAGVTTTLLVWGIIVSFFGYIAYKGLLGLYYYGFEKIFLTDEFSLGDVGKGVSFWAPFGVTVFVAVIAVTVSVPWAIKCAVWMTFHCNERVRKRINTILILFSNLPSIILGVFIRNHLSFWLKSIFSLENSLNLITAAVSLMLLMIPLVVSLFMTSLENQSHYLGSTSVLGMDKGFAVYKVLIPKVRRTIAVAITIVTGRVLSESVMLSMLLSSENYTVGYSSMHAFVNSQMHTMAPLISQNFFSDGSDENVQSLMFLFGCILLLIILTFNALCMWVFSRLESGDVRNSRYSRYSYCKCFIVWNLSSLFWRYCKDAKVGRMSIYDYLYKSSHGVRLCDVSSWIRKFLEWLSILVFGLFVLSILTSVTVSGIDSILKWDRVQYDVGQDTLWRALLNTIVVIIIAVFFAIPISLCTAVYLSEFAREGRFKRFSLSLINSAAATPSIIYGIFGLSLFIHTFGWTITGSTGKSLLAGILTLIMIIIPYASNLFYTHMSNVSNLYRESSYTLGITRIHVFRKIVLPLTLSSIVFSIFLSVGKIVGETAPLYLTAGMNSASSTLLLYPGQTLSTRIYSQLFESNLEKREMIMGETTFFCVLFIGMMIVIGRHGIPALQRLSLGTRLHCWMSACMGKWRRDR